MAKLTRERKSSHRQAQSWIACTIGHWDLGRVHHEGAVDVDAHHFTGAESVAVEHFEGDRRDGLVQVRNPRRFGHVEGHLGPAGIQFHQGRDQIGWREGLAQNSRN